jgi:hypothetical protein
MKPNTIVFGFYNHQDEDRTMSVRYEDFPSEEEDAEIKAARIFAGYPTGGELSAEDYLAVIRQSILYEKNICIGRYFNHLNRKEIVEYRGSIPTYFNRKKRLTIDMWPILLPNRFDYTRSSELLLMLGHITKQTDIWAKYSKLRVKGIARNESEVDFIRTSLENLVSSVRIRSRVEVITLTDSRHTLLRNAISHHGLNEDASNFEDLPNNIRYPILNQIMRSESETTCK